jgi:hypothetical protein
MKDVSIESSCSEETLRNQQSIEPEQEVQVFDDLLSGRKYQTCLVWPRQQHSKQDLVTMIRLDGDQVMSQLQYLATLTTHVLWPRKAR